MADFSNVTKQAIGVPLMRGNGDVVNNYKASDTPVEPGLCVGLDSNGKVVASDADTIAPLGVSGYTEFERTPVIQSNTVAIQLASGTTPTVGAQVNIDTNGKAASSGNPINAIYLTGKIEGINAKTREVITDGAAVIEFQKI